MFVKLKGFLRRTPFRSFVFYPLLVLGWEFLWQGERLQVRFLFLPLMIWGYLQYRLCGLYRKRRGGGGPGLETPPQRLVMTGPYAYTRNPMYLGHIIFLTGLAVTFHSLLAAAIALATAVWFHLRVLGDEKRLAERIGPAYIDYTARVKRWIPGLF